MLISINTTVHKCLFQQLEFTLRRLFRLLNEIYEGQSPKPTLDT